MASERPLNALEDLFARCNVRFAVLLVLEDGTVDALFQQAVAACSACRLGRLALCDRDQWMLQTDKVPTMAPGRDDVRRNVDDFGTFLDGSMGEALPPHGSVCIRTIPYKQQGGLRVMGLPKNPMNVSRIPCFLTNCL